MPLFVADNVDSCGEFLTQFARLSTDQNRETLNGVNVFVHQLISLLGVLSIVIAGKSISMSSIRYQVNGIYPYIFKT